MNFINFIFANNKWNFNKLANIASSQGHEFLHSFVKFHHNYIIYSRSDHGPNNKNNKQF